jgi:hypothetical protein
MTDFGIGTVLGKVAGKVMNAANSSQELMCLGKCDKITKHISISYADLYLSHSIGRVVEDTIDSIGGTIADLMPVWPLLFGNSYACTCCNKIRWHGGVLSSLLNENSKSSYLKKK